MKLLASIIRYLMIMFTRCFISFVILHGDGCSIGESACLFRMSRATHGHLIETIPAGARRRVIVRSILLGGGREVDVL